MSYIYLKDPQEIYRQSFAIAEAEADLSSLPEMLHPVAIRLIHACGMTDIVRDLTFSPDIVHVTTKAVQNNCSIFCDSEMVYSGLIKRFLSSNKIFVTLNDQRVPDLAKELETTRSAAAVELWKDNMAGALIVIGNAPTALFHLLEKLEEGWPRPAAILGFPVGFVGAAESKQALANYHQNIPFLTILGRRGGSAMACAALNALAMLSTEEIS